MIFAPWQRQAELQQTQAQTAMQQMQMAAFPEQQRRAQELQQAQVEHYKAQAEEQRALAMKNQAAVLQSINDERAARGLPELSFGQIMSGQGAQPAALGTTRPELPTQIPQQMQGAPTTPQQLVGGMGAGQAPVINAQGQYTSQPAMNAINNNMGVSIQRLNNLTAAGRVTGPLYEKTLKDVQDAGKAASEIAKNDAARLKSVTDTAQSKLDYVTQLAQVVKTPKDFESAMKMADESGVQWPLPRNYADAKSFIDRLRTDSKQAVDINATRQLEAERRAQTAKANTEQAIKNIELQREKVIDAEAKRQSEAVKKSGGIVTAEQVKEQQKEVGKLAARGVTGDFGDVSTPEERSAFTMMLNAQAQRSGTQKISLAQVNTVMDQVDPKYRAQLNTLGSIQKVAGTLETSRQAQNISDFVSTHKIKTGLWGEALKKLDSLGLASTAPVSGDQLASVVGNQLLGKYILDFINAYARAERGGPTPTATVAEIKAGIQRFAESQMSGKSTAIVFNEIAKERVRRTESELFGGEKALTVKPHAASAEIPAATNQPDQSAIIRRLKSSGYSIDSKKEYYVGTDGQIHFRDKEK